jgi:hypothetical protein
MVIRLEKMGDTGLNDGGDTAIDRLLRHAVFLAKNREGSQKVNNDNGG